MIDIKNKLILLTGGSGYLAGAVIPKLLKHGARVRALARNEGNLIKAQQLFPEIEIYPGDISDSVVVKQAMVGVDAVIHCSAFKLVALSEDFSRETVLSNVVGTLNLLEESLNYDLDFFVNISTDKASQVSCSYSATKYIGETLVKQFSKIKPSNKYRTCRYGNVLKSTSSVLTIWEKLIKEGKEVTLTNPDASRFWWSRDAAADFIFKTIEEAPDAEPYIPEMKGASMSLLLAAALEKYGNGSNVPVKITSLNPSDNLHERMRTDGLFSNEVEQFTKEELIELI